MILFLVLSIPLWFLFLNSFYRNEGIRKRDFIIPLGKGSVIFICSLLLTWLLTGTLSLGRATLFNLYFYDLSYYNGLTNIIWLTLFFVIQVIWPPVRMKIRTRELMLFLVPLFFGDSLYHWIIQESWYGLYELYFLPLSNMTLLILLALIISREEKEDLIKKILYYLLSIMTILILNFIPLLFSYNLILIAILVGIIFFSFSLFLFIIELKRK
jgi:hypothetical protein